jgi:hypothetical protein
MRDTIELCKAVGFPLMVFEGVTYVSPELERLVALVRADERAATDLQAELDATNRQVEILSDALAESRRGVDAMVALARADQREACAALADKLEWADNKGVASAIRARGNT